MRKEVKKMKTWRPASWSQQAREMCNKQIEYINGGHAFIEDALHLFSNSYRAPIITDRAAKRFGRLMRAGKVKENISEYIKNYPFDAKAKGLI